MSIISIIYLMLASIGIILCIGFIGVIEKLEELKK